MPLTAPGLETPKGGFYELQPCRSALAGRFPAQRLLDVAAEVELGTGEPDNTIEPRFHFWR
jgi:hypothetical protein